MSESDTQTDPEPHEGSGKPGERPEIEAARRKTANRIRQRLAERIERTGITMKRLSDRSGVAKSTIYRLLQDESSDARVNTLAALASVLLIDVQQLFEPLPDEEDEG